MSTHWGSMDDAGLPGEKELLKSASARVIAQDRIRELLEKARRTVSVPIRLGPITNGDAMKDTGLPQIGSLAGVELSSTRQVAKGQDPFSWKAVGGFGPSGLEGDEPRGFSLLRKKSQEPAPPNFRPGQRVKHRPSGAHAVFLKDNRDGTARVSYSEGDEADHPMEELCGANDSGKASSSAFTKRASFNVGDHVILPDGSAGEIVKLTAGVAYVRCGQDTAMVLTKSLRPAGMRKSAMPQGSPVWVRLPGSSREVRASLVSYDTDRLVVQFADGTQSVITPEQCRTIDEAMLQNPMTVIGRQGNDYRLIPNGPSGLIQAPKAAGVFSLLKGVKPFTQATSIGAGGDGSMADTGL